MEKRLDETAEVADNMLDEVVFKTQEMFNTANPHELKLALAHFIEKIDLLGNEVTMCYSFAPASKGIVPVGSDPSGIRTRDLHRDRVAC